MCSGLNVLNPSELPGSCNEPKTQRENDKSSFAKSIK